MTADSVSADTLQIARQWGIDIDAVYFCSDVKRLLCLNDVEQVYFLIQTGQLEAFKITKSWRIKGLALVDYLQRARKG